MHVVHVLLCLVGPDFGLSIYSVAESVSAPLMLVSSYEFSAAAIFLASVYGKCLRYTEDVDVVFTKKNSSLLTLERGR